MCEAHALKGRGIAMTMAKCARCGKGTRANYLCAVCRRKAQQETQDVKRVFDSALKEAQP